MKNSLLILAVMLLAGSSCNNTFNNIFTNRTPHEAYAHKVKNDPLGEQWVKASGKALLNPQLMELPYNLAGYFHTDKPRALAIRFRARQGERINFELEKDSAQNFVLFADLYRQDSAGASHLLAVDTISPVFGYDVAETGDYVLRIQPALHRTGKYRLSATAGPSLDFPVAGKNAKTGSFWGDARDGGKRSHEGIDIFAAKRTPVVAAADGFITRVAEGGIGGKTIWMRTNDHDVYLYYAHLDQQLVGSGQSVKRGDTLGLVGNTGNAKYTPPHLHFGVYTSAGPVDPFPFVNTRIRTAPSIAEKNLDDILQVKTKVIKKDTLMPLPGELIVPLAQTKDTYIVERADGTITQIPTRNVSPFKSENSLVKEKTRVSGTGAN